MPRRPTDLEDRAATLHNHAEALSFESAHAPYDLPVSDAFRRELIEEIRHGDITPEAADVQLQEQVIEEVFDKTGADER